MLRLCQGLTNLIKPMSNQMELKIHHYLVGTISYVCANCGLCMHLHYIQNITKTPAAEVVDAKNDIS